MSLDGFRMLDGLTIPGFWFSRKSSKIARDPKNLASKSRSLFDLLPPEILAQILSNLNTLDIYKLSLTSKEWMTRAWVFTDHLDLAPFRQAAASYHVSQHQRCYRSSQSLMSSDHINSTKNLVRMVEPTKIDTSENTFCLSNDDHRRQSSNSPRLTRPQKPILSISETGRMSRSLEEIQIPAKSNSPHSAAGDHGPPRQRLNASSDSIRASSSNSMSPINESKNRGTETHRSSNSPNTKYRQPWNTTKFLKCLLPRIPISTLVEISLSGCVVNQLTFKAIASTCRSTLACLNLYGCSGLSASCMKYIAKLNLLEYLNLRACDGMNEDSLKYLSRLSNLKYLDLKDIEISKRHVHITCHQKSLDSCFLGLTPIEARRAQDLPKRSSEMIFASPTSNLLQHHLGKSADTVKFGGESSLLTSELDSDGESGEDYDDPVAEAWRHASWRTRRQPLEKYTASTSIFKCIPNLTNLTALNISEWTSDPDSYKYLTNLVHLKSLHVQHSLILDTIASHLTNLEHLSFSNHRYANYYCDPSHFDLASKGKQPKDNPIQNINTNHSNQNNNDLPTIYASPTLQPPRTFEKLIALSFANCYRMDDSGLITVSLNVPNVQDLRLSSCDAITDYGIINALVRWASSLKFLDLRGLDKITDNSIISFYSLVHLEFINLRKCVLLTSSCFEVLSTLNRLSGLDLSKCAQIGEGLEKLVASPQTRLRYLSVRGCGGLKIRNLINFLHLAKSLVHLDIRECSNLNLDLASSRNYEQLKESLPYSLVHLWSDAPEVGSKHKSKR